MADNNNFRNRSSDLRELIQEPISASDVDLDLGVVNSDTSSDDDVESLLDFSSGSDDIYEPRRSEIDEWEVENRIDFGEPGTSTSRPTPNWPTIN